MTNFMGEDDAPAATNTLKDTVTALSSIRQRISSLEADEKALVQSLIDRCGVSTPTPGLTCFLEVEPTLTVTVTWPESVSWDQDELAKIAAVEPTAPITATFRVSKADYEAASPAERAALDVHRTVKAGKPKIVIVGD